MSQIFNQSTLQRVSSMKSLTDARRCMIINIPVTVFFGFSTIVTGWCLYAYLYIIQCDPVQAGILGSSDQLTPFFVVHVMHDIPGMAGLYMSSMFSGALSTISSGINALAANTVEDILQKPLRSVSEETATIITKVAVFVYGIAIISVAYAASAMGGLILQMATSVVSPFGSAVVGIFLLGCCVPWANKYGAFIGAVTSLALNLWIGIGSKFYGRTTQPLNPVSSDGCFNSTTSYNNYTSNIYMDDIHFTTSPFSNFTQYSTAITETTDTVDSLPSSFSIYDISYQWYSVIGVVVCFLVGLIVSRITRSKATTTSDPRLILHFLRPFWGLGDGRELTVHNEDIDCYYYDMPELKN